MDKAMLIVLLERYWQAETTVEEERALAAYFREHEDPDEELQPYRELFAYYDEEAEVTAGPDFGYRILQRLGIDDSTRQVPVKPMHSFGAGVFTAAAAIVLVVASVFLLKPEPERVSDKAPTQLSSVRDTYENPQQALAAVQRALLMASVELNRGRQEVIDPHK